MVGLLLNTVTDEKRGNTNQLMSDPSPYLVIVVFLVAAVTFCLVPLLAARAWAKTFSPPKPGADKNSTYECGVESKGDAWVRFKPEYYLYAILFLIFDVEAIFLLPFAVAFTGLPIGAFVAMLIFLLLLVEGLAWAWQKGVLTWK
jgi:NADH:ubiquinone oxidoreductase subunit 3 (subunit A)